MPINDIRAARRKFGLSQQLVARLLNVSLRTVSGAESKPVVPNRLRRNIAQTMRLCEALGDVMDASFVSEWLQQPNEMLDGLSAVEAMERGKMDLVWQVVHGLQSGTPL